MAVDVCSEVSSLAVSPRISFSHDLRDADPPNIVINRSDALLLESIDFNFCITTPSFSPDVLSSADELFSDGKILPAVVKSSTAAAAAVSDLRSKPISPRFRNINPVAQKKSLKEFLSLNLDSDAETESGEEKNPAPAPAGKPFWKFRRSSSLNFDHYRSNNTLLRSLHFLSRSNSTGSAPTSKTPSSSTSVPANIMRKSSSSSSSSSTRTNPNSSYKRTPSRKNYGNPVRISPVLNLNIPHACISRGTVNLFGLGSLFCNGKSKKKKKCNH